MHFICRPVIKQPWLRNIVKKQLEQISREKLSGPSTKSTDKVNKINVTDMNFEQSRMLKE